MGPRPVPAELSGGYPGVLQQMGLRVRGAVRIRIRGGGKERDRSVPGARAIAFLTMILSLVVGCTGLVLKEAFPEYHEGVPGWGAYLTCFLISFVVIYVMFGVVDGALNTVIVCYAEAPNEFQQNHPLLSEEMREAWVKVHPELF